MQKLTVLFLLVVLAFVVDAGTLRHKRQLYGPGLGGPMGGGLYGGPMGGGYGPGLTPGQMITDRNLAIAQARGHQALINSQMATNRAVQQANFNAAILGAEARANIAEANMRAMALGK